MRLSGDEDLRVQKTVTSIRQTFDKLLLEMDYSKITVTHLCEQARINKKTFYRYYETLDVLLEEVLEEMTLGYLERIAQYRIPEDLEAINREFFTYSAEQGEVYERIVCSASFRTIGGKMIGDIVNRTWNTSAVFRRLDKLEQNLLLVFINNLGTGLFRQWVLDGKKMPLEKLVNLSYALLNQGVSGFIEVTSRQQGF